MTQSTTTPNPRVGAVVVLYNPESDVLENLRVLAVQVDALVIVDNGSSEAFRDLLEPILNARVELIRHPENLGIATGFNTGVRRLIELGCGFVFTFDQDSRIPDGFAQGMVNSMLEAERCFGRVGVLLPVWSETEPGPMTVKNQFCLFEARLGISSGSLYREEIFAQIGFFADEYFIDGIDVEFCLRCRQRQYKVIQEKSWLVLHRLGQKTNVKVLGAAFQINIHSVFRKYYISRNRVLNYKKYGSREIGWFCNDLAVVARELFHVLAYEDSKTKRLKNMIVGTLDGIRNKTGKISTSDSENQSNSLV
jgi:rhamnosyltransferase